LTADVPVPRDRDLSAADIPSTYVPARNTIFLAIALGWAETIDARDLFIGVNALDYSGYPDCRPEFIAAFESLASVATRAGVEGARFRVHTPLITLSKADIIRRGLAMGLDYGLTHSCYDPDEEGRPCGHCDSCLLRAKGFAEAGAHDPLLAR
jgi:7-cyano-7-deazaguanine synthase